MPTESKAAPAGFSLVELLLAIAIVTILFALLLPVLSKAKLRAQELRCLNSVRNIGVANLLFTHDHNDRLPPHCVFARPPAEAVVPNPHLTYWADLLRPYVSHPGTFLCPCHSPTNAALINIGQNLGVVGFSYSLSENHGLPDAWIARPGETILYGDVDYVSPDTKGLTDPDAWQADSTLQIGIWTIRPPIDPAFHAWPSRLINRHAGRANVGFADGHVDSLPSARLGWQHPWGHRACQWDTR